MNKRDYYSVHAHSEFSNIKVIDSINRYNRMIDYAWDIGLSGIAMTEHDTLSGALKYLKAFKKKIEKEWLNLYPNEEKFDYNKICKELDFKPILGNEIYLTPDNFNEDFFYPDEFYHLILLAKDAEGFKQIKQLSSRAWQRSWFRGILRTPTYSKDLLEIVKGGHLICSSACLGGYLGRNFLKMRELKETEEKNPNDLWLVGSEGEWKIYRDKIENHLSAMEDLFGKGNYYIELQPNDEKYGEEQNAFNKYMIENYWGKYPFIFSTDAHYLKADERNIHKDFLNSKSSKDREVDDFYHYAYIMTQDEVRELMSYVTDEQFEEMVRNTQKIKDMCEFYELSQKQVVTKVKYEHFDEYEGEPFVFSEVNEENYPNFYYFLTSNDRTNQYFIRLIAHGYNQMYDNSWSDDVYYARLEEELWTIKEVSERMGQNMADYFISMAKMIDLMWESGSIVGPSRGSAGALLINYLLGITQMNPIEMELPFVWRFLHPSRPDMPDIDVDTESDKRAKVFMAVKEYFNSIGGDVVNICTFGTEGTKSALKTAGRGLNINDEVISYLTSMIPNERGFDWSLQECYYGNEEEGRKPIKAFIEEMNKYPRLWELSQSIEGLVTRLGVHASGVVAVNDDFFNHNSLMKTNSEQIVSAFDLHDSEEMGLIKYDFLTVSALDRIHQTLNYMLEDGTIEWQGSLRKTYNKYIGVKNLDYTNQEMWDLAAKGKVISLFQFDTIVGTQAMREIKPRTVVELASASSLMRLMSDGELPLDTYVKYRNNPSLWYLEMDGYQLTQDEVKIIEKYLKKKNGVAESQEVLMQIVMDPKISNFSMQEANKLRKTIAKKQFREIDKVKELFFEKGKANGASENLLKYIWYVQINKQLGYSFSEIHTTGYALIALQEMNLANRFPIIYWNCACLSVNASAINSQDFENLIEENIIEVEEETEDKKQTKIDYAKIATAIDSFKNDVTIKLPDINKSKLGFTPNVEENAILYGLKGISKISGPVIEEIMMNRPYKSFQDFMNRTSRSIVKKDKVINLIKCGAFDKIENKNRTEILKDYLWTTCEPKKKLTMQNVNMLIDQGLIPVDFNKECEVYKLTKELRKHRDANKLWYIGQDIKIDEEKAEIWLSLIEESKVPVETVYLQKEGYEARVLNSDKWDMFYTKNMDKIKTYIKTHHDELLEKLNNKLFEDEFNKYGGNETEDMWELESINFFFTNHPLEKVIPQLPVNIDKVSSIEEGTTDGNFYINGKTIPHMHLYTVAGTVIDKDNTKGLVTIQTPDGVVTIKCYKDLYALYAQTIVGQNENGEEIILEDSFFEKGTHLLVTGIQRGVTFIPKVYKNTGRKAIERIILDGDGNFDRFIQKRAE